VFSGKAVFGSERTDHANAIIDGTGLRIDHSRRRGRGAGINPSGRFESQTRIDSDDGWNSLEKMEAFKTEVQIEKPRSIITRNDSP
ncbi:radical SAM protein, partial [Ochrobactrum sp. SFR4]|nr:radical SAM protein [Ochrobactrum sp. SFR4]